MNSNLTVYLTCAFCDLRYVRFQMPDQPVRQHWVPRVYLRAFCAQPIDREQIYAKNLLTGDEFITALDRVAVKRHMYTLSIGTENESFAVEAALSKLESDFREVLTNIRTNFALPTSTSARILIARYIGTQLMRTRQGLQMIHGHREDVRAGSPETQAKLSTKQAAHLLSLDDDGMREEFAKSVIELGAVLGKHIFSMNWQLICAVEADSYFITSENPVYCFHPTEKIYGIGTLGTSTFFPISPTLLLHCSNTDTYPNNSFINFPSAGVRSLNGLTLLASEQFIYSHKPFTNIADLLNDRPDGKGRAFGPRNPKPSRSQPKSQA
jgi:Protein of unknown function (DUF4238)